MIGGQGLHGGAPSAVDFGPCDGGSRFRIRGQDVLFADLTVDPVALRSTVVQGGGHRIATVEHLFAAAAACGAHRRLVVTLHQGSEIPLADGGAAAFAAAISALALPAGPPRLRIAAEGIVAVGGSIYAFRRGDRATVDVTVDFSDDRLARHAEWDGTLDDFVARIAPARTFGFAHEVSELLERGLASHVSPESVVVIGEREILSAGRAFTADEPARHKLLDLVGDLFVHGGPPTGHVSATKPGHAATHAAMAEAKRRGLVVDVAS